MSTLYRVAAEYESEGQRLVNVWHVAAGGSEEQLIATTFVTYGWGSLKTFVSEHVVALSVTVTDVEQATQYVVSLDNEAGEVAGEMCPLQTAGLISWRSNLIGRANRGRTYVPGVPESFQASGVLTAAGISALNTVAASLRTSWPNAFGGQLVIRHQTELPSWIEVSSYLVRTIVATQRRRRQGVGS